MAQVTTATALVDLQNWTRAYQRLCLQYSQIKKNQDTISAQTADDSALVQASSAAIMSTAALQGSTMGSVLAAILDEFATSTLGMSGQDATTNLLSLVQYTQDNNKEVVKRGTVFGAAADGGSNIGTQQLFVCGTDRLGKAIESASIETLTFKCLGQAAARESIGLEAYQVTGAGIGAISELDLNGVGITPVAFQAIGPGRSALLDNASFDLPFVGSSTTKIQNWTIVSGETNIARDTTVYFQDRGGTPASLLITGNCKLRYDFRKFGKALSPFIPYIGGLEWKAAAAAGTITIRVGTATGTYTNNVVTSNSDWGAHDALTLNPNQDDAWLQVFDTDGHPYFEIEVSGWAANMYIDDAFFSPMIGIGGRPFAIVSGYTPALINDSHTQECTLDVGTGSVELTGGGAGSVDSITVTQPDATTVQLLTAAVPFNTSLAQTAADVATNINKSITSPQYKAAVLSGAIVTIYQIVPVAGSFTVTSTCTTITKTDTNITGGSIGTIQDSVVRNTGLYLNHDTAATTGWGDPAAFNGAS